ncbi:trypsin-like serine protease [Pseudorhodobacter turbinis]|uniref:Trypsin-like serine protease n=1 Tax=Pseudorhodobacter turbinis TaxID=2500533 RepID=A0A4P8EGM2_9RHOB|nr:trypsin-like peptidase domain-containing protein [Pseudorhodobacter turbinis]QCO55873.1 trypsin-like serine protease [Pseudorhodobacter turbinis]
MARTWRIGLGALLIGAAGQVAAQEVPSAIGRISYGNTFRSGSAICTGVLVTPDLVLTARHCLARSQARPGMVQFAAGYSAGRSVVTGRGAEVILSTADVTASMANDVALLRLASPVPMDLVAPLPLASPDAGPPSAPFNLFAYRRDTPEQAERQDDCALLTTAPGVLALSCRVVSGNSGAPVLAKDGEAWQIHAVMVASSRGGQVHSLAALVPPDLRARIEESF